MTAVARSLAGQASEAAFWLCRASLPVAASSTCRCFASEPAAASTSGTPPAEASAPSRGEELHEIRARVFGYHVGDGKKSGRKVLARPLKGAVMADWYFSYPKDVPLLLNEDEEYRFDRAEERRAAGKGPPKKGQGKRSKR